MVKKISLVFTAQHLKNKNNIVHSTAVIYDVLRASSTIITALAHGAREIIPAADPHEALKLYRNLSETTANQVLLGGERYGETIPGFHLGNSPLEYTENLVKNSIIVFTTTNGTRALLNCHEMGARKILIGGILNQKAIVRYLLNESEITLVCAGSKGQFAYEDFLAAGLMVKELLRHQSMPQLDDGALAACDLARAIHDKPTAIARGMHGKSLLSGTKAAEVQFCATPNLFSVLPVYTKSKIRLNLPVHPPGSL